MGKDRYGEREVVQNEKRDYSTTFNGVFSAALCVSSVVLCVTIK